MNLSIDLLGLIFDILPISDKRVFIMSCKEYTHFAKNMHLIEKKFQDTIDNIYFFGHKKSRHFNKLQILTIELLYDGYMLPDQYFIEDNYVLHRYPAIYFDIALKGHMILLKKMIKFLQVTNLYHFMERIFIAIGNGAAEAGNIELLSWICGKKMCALQTSEIIMSTVCGGHIDMIEWIHNKFNIKHINIVVDGKKFNLFIVAAKYGHMHIIKFFISIGLCYNYADCFIGASLGLESSNCLSHPEKTIDKINILKWAAKMGTKKNCACDYLSGADDLTLFEWAIDEGYKHGDYVCYFAAYNNKFDRLKHFYNIGHKLNTKTFAAAARHGNIDMMEWLIFQMKDHNCYPDKSAYYEAADTGQLETIKWLREKNYPCDDKILEHCFTNIEILKYALDNGAKLNDILCHLAIDEENIDILDLIRKNYVWTAELDEYIMKTKHKGIIEWTNSYS